ncbi:E3 ubiquitin-protein ligase sspH2 [Enhygromyxa salina]|uniref:E3 ubiquitin-protein ligase sspH2 n=1 Tax=Enhygromyxa salina TaxID=215803 RepID=A0A2S9YXL8_9BACT|nr:E3 ubiquitin-protein ligase sspH2 [Enhygromyxa salina]
MSNTGRRRICSTLPDTQRSVLWYAEPIVTKPHPVDSRVRPAAVPSEAWWSAKDNEWVHGHRDPDGELHGEVRYWRPDGTWCCATYHRHGQPHGSFTRFHETGEISQTGSFEAGQLHGQHTLFAATGYTTENMHAGGISREIVRSEYDYINGHFTTIRYFGADGTALQTDGTPLPSRPSGVPAHAIRNSKSGTWLAGRWDSQGRREGPLEVFDADGRRLAIETYRQNLAHGPTTLFYPGGTLRAVLAYANGKLHGTTESFYRDGTLARRAQFKAGEWAGTLSDWSPSGELIDEVSIVATPPASPPPAEPSELALRGDVAAAAVEAVAEAPISAAGMARLIAIGWGGDEERDATLARVARRVVRARQDPALTEALRETGLDTAPRLLTATRLRRVITAMRAVPAVDQHALVPAFAERGGVGRAAVLDRDDAMGVAALRAQVNGERLNLSNKGLERLPRAIRRLASVRVIDARDNQITEVPPEIAGVFFLREADLTSNRLATLPDQLARLGDLRELQLASNQFATLPQVVTKLTELEVLGLGDNELVTLPADIGRLTHLGTLWLHGNPLAGLPDSFAQLSSLTFLHLGDLPWATPSPVIFELESLRELWLASPSLTHLPADIGRLTKLERLSIWYSGLTELPDALFEMTSLREIRIRDNPLPAGVIERLKEAHPDCKIF